MSQLELMLEAEKRGILPEDKQAILNEARSRGLIEEAGPRDLDFNLMQKVIGGEAQLTPQELEELNRRQDEFQAQAQPIAGALVGGTAGILGKGILSAAALGGIGGATGEEAVRTASGEDFDLQRFATGTAVGTGLGAGIGKLIPTVGKLVKKLGISDDLAQSKALITEGLKSAKNLLKGKVDDAWGLIDNSSGLTTTPGVSAFVRQNLATKLDDITEPDVHDWAQRLLQRSIPESHDRTIIGLKDLVGYRKSLNRAYGTDSQKNRAIGLLRGQLDDEIMTITKSALYNGSPKDAKLVRKAVDLSKEFKNTWDSNRILRTLTDDNANPDQTLNFLFNHNSIARNKDAVQVLKIIDQQSPKTLKEIQNAAKFKIAHKVDGTPRSGEEIAAFLDRMNLEHNQLSATLFKGDWPKIRKMAPKFRKATDLGTLQSLKEKIGGPLLTIGKGGLFAAGIGAAAEGSRSLWDKFR